MAEGLFDKINTFLEETQKSLDTKIKQTPILNTFNRIFDLATKRGGWGEEDFMDVYNVMEKTPVINKTLPFLQKYPTGLLFPKRKEIGEKLLRQESMGNDVFRKR